MNISKILVITLSNIGDVVLSTAVLDALNKLFPDAGITVMAGPKACSVVEDITSVEDIVVYNKHAGMKEKISLALELSRRNFDLVVDLRHTAFPLLIRSRYRTKLFRNRKKTEGMHAVARHLSHLTDIGISVDGAGLLLGCSKKNEMFADDLFAETGFAEKDVVAIAPGAASPLKRWKSDGFRELAEYLSGNGYKILVAGSESDRDATSVVCRDSDFLDLTGKTSLGELASILKRVCLFITNDSGPMHLACAAGTPVLAIFGPTDPAVYGPYGKGHRIITSSIDCVPCREHHCYQNNHACMQKLDAKVVIDTAMEMLGGR